LVVLHAYYAKLGGMANQTIKKISQVTQCNPLVSAQKYPRFAVDVLNNLHYDLRQIHESEINRRRNSLAL